MKRQGFTLLEVVVSLGILALGVLGIFSLIPTGVEQTRQVHEQSRAIILAQSKLEDLMAKASTDWENFNSWKHYFHSDSSNFKEPAFLGPNTLSEREAWGWVKVENNDTTTTWNNDIGYQWVWNFVDYDDMSTGTSIHYPKTKPTTPYDIPIALITVTVSWPQKYSAMDNSSGENTIINWFWNRNETELKKRNIQFVRLISYVSKGL